MFLSNNNLDRIKFLLPSHFNLKSMKNKFTDIDIEAFILSNNKDADFKSLPEMTMEYAEYVKHPSHPVGDYKAVWIESSLKHSIFIKTLKEITKEKEYSAKLLRDFATAPFKYFDGDAEKVTLSMLNQKLIGLLVRYQRANAILDTRMNENNTTHDGSYTYNTKKIYWVDDMGNNVRNVTRNDGSEETNEKNMITKLARLYKKLKYKTDTEAIIRENGKFIKPDLVIEKDNLKLVVEIKKSDVAAYNKIFATYELWILYKSIYMSDTSS